MGEGIIFKALSGFYYVDGPDGPVTCRARGKFRHRGESPLVGDRVTYTQLEDGSGALDSILDICMACVLFTRLSPARFVVSPLPIADGEVVCAHGVIPVPAPAVLELLEGIPVRPFSGEGETVTPTAIALLRSLGATFGPWPAMLVERRALVYGARVFANAPNGTIFACGTELEG